MNEQGSPFDRFEGVVQEMSELRASSRQCSQVDSGDMV